MTSSFLIFGETSLTAQCIEHLLLNGHEIVGLHTDDAWLQSWAEEKKIPLVEDFQYLPSFDFLLSIVNPKIIPEIVIRAAKKLSINYHDSPLPKYAGVHATSWALLQGEKQHGITWHLITEKIDAGDIIKQVNFEIDPSETAITLNLKCYEYAILSFKALIGELEENSYQLEKQNLSLRTYFGAHKKPSHFGFLNWEEGAESCERIFRALYFGNQPNRLCSPKVLIGSSFLVPIGFETTLFTSSALPGTIVKATPSQLQVATATVDVILTFKTQQLSSWKYKKGMRLPDGKSSIEDSLVTFYSRQEKFWTLELKKQHPLSLKEYIFPLKKCNKVNIEYEEQLHTEDLLTAISIYLCRLTGQMDLSVHLSMKMNDSEVGLFSNTLPLNLSLSEHDTFSILRSKIEDKLASLEERKGFFTDIYERYPELDPTTHSRILISITDQIESCQLPLEFDHGFFFSIKESKVLLLSKPETSFPPFISAHLKKLLMYRHTKDRIEDYSFLDEEEVKFTNQSSSTHGKLPPFIPVSNVITEHSIKTPDVTAVVCDDMALSYRELEEKTTYLCRYLKSQNIGPEDVVGICAEKSIELVIALLAVMKSGGSFILLDPELPQKRIEHILTETEALLVLTIGEGSRFAIPYFDLSSIGELPLEHPVKSPISPTSRAYILYTSGTTGNPKGVEVEHSQLFYALTARTAHYQLDTVRSLWMGSVSFDVSIANILFPLFSGGTLYCSKKIHQTDPDGILSLLNRYHITHFCGATSLYSMLLEKNGKCSCPSLRYVCMGGESLRPGLVQRHKETFPQARFLNEYGPTECTIWCSFSVAYDPDEAVSEHITIGKPVQHATLRVLDQHLRQLPLGLRGEIYIGGNGLTRGYLKDPMLTSKKFITTKNWGRVYKSGDLGSVLHDGNIHFWGRVDQQIKFRGYRIEIEEIESRLCQHPAINQAMAVICTNKSQIPQLTAYLSLKSTSTLSHEELKLHLEAFLPHYMIPSSFIIAEAIPLTHVGKVDRNLVPKGSTLAIRTTPHVALNTETERHIAAIWSEVLGLKNVSASDHFFECGGHSLFAVQAIVKMQDLFQVEIQLKSLYEKSILREFANHLDHLLLSSEKRIATTYPEIVKDLTHRYGPFPLTDIQQAYWLGRNEAFALSQIAVHGYYEYDVDILDIKPLEKSWNALITRHEALRLIFHDDGTQQILADPPYYAIKVNDFSLMGDELLQTKLGEIRTRLSHQVLPTAQWPLFEINVSILPHSYRLHVSIDGLIIDGWSFNLLLSEWVKLYQDSQTLLPELGVSFRDYVLTEQSIKNSPLYERDREYWQKRLVDFPLAPKLPLAKQHTEIEKPVFNRCSKLYPKQNWEKIKVLLKEHNITPTTFLLTLFAEVLQFWSHSAHFSINLTLFNRLPLHSQINDILGDFTSLIICEVDLRQKRSFLEKLHNIQTQLFADLDHRLYTGIEVIRELGREKQIHWDTPLFPIVFTSLLSEESEERYESFLSSQGYSITQTPQVWLDFKAYTTQGDLVIEWDYVQDLFPKDLIDTMHHTFYLLLEELAQSEWSWNKNSFDLLPEKQTLQREAYNQTAWNVEYSLLHELFISQAYLFPQAPAIFFDDRVITYEELRKRSNQIAHGLKKLGVQPNTLIGIVIDKSPEQIIACLSILIAGAAYLPINPEFPETKIKELIDLGEVGIVITQSKYFDKIPSVEAELQIIDIEADFLKERHDDIPSLQNLNDLAYVIFTSGSTGVPKGVMIDHKGAVNTILDINERFNLSSNDRVFALSNLNFDLSVYDIFGPLACGAAIVLPKSEDIKEPKRWLELIHLHCVTIWNSVPMFMKMLVEYLEQPEQCSNHLRLVLLSGDWIPLSLPEAVIRTFPRASLISLGGATEASIWSIYFPIGEIDSEWKSIPYGIPLRNQMMYVLNDQLQHCPDLAVGDIYIGGVGLAKGYWKDPERTHRQFIPHPAWHHTLYKTGDLGCFHPEGWIEFLGRKDNQVKINGYRIELGEIQKALGTHPDVSSALIRAVGEKDQEKDLIAYVILKDAAAPVIQTANILDPVERTAFKLSNKNLRKFADNAFVIPLNLKECKSADIYRRKSYRRFDGSRHDSFALLNLLKGCFFHHHVKEMKGQNAADASSVESLLSSIAAYSLPSQPLPKYPYPSAGSLYPVQVYLQANSVEGIPNGFYYFDPVEHSLKKCENSFYSNLNFESPFNLILVGKEEAIQPLYGSFWRKFCLLEMGYLSQLLFQTADRNDSPLSSEKCEPSLPCLILDRIRRHRQHETLECYLFVKKDAFEDIEEGWYRYNEISQTLSLVDSSIPFTPQMGAHDNYAILHDASFFLFLLGKQFTEAGRLSQTLMELGVDSQLGFCPLGALDPTALNQAAQVFDTNKVLHILAGGSVSQEQIEELHSSDPKDPKEIICSSLQSFLKNIIPEYSIPSSFLFLEQFPLSVNGKIDMKSLPLPNAKSQSKSFIPPRTEIECQLASIWKDILKKDKIGIHDHFFHMGGHSLSAVQTLSKIRKTFGLEFPIKTLFENPTLEKFSQLMANAIDQTSKAAYPKISKVAQDCDYPLSYPQQRLWFLDQLVSNKTVYNITMGYKITGPLCVNILKASLNVLIQRHESLRTVFSVENGIAKQVVLDPYPFELKEFNTDNLQFHMELEGNTPFDLEKGPLLRGRIGSTTSYEHIFLITMHHIITDEWSIRLFYEELKVIYDALSRSQTLSTTSSRLSYIDFSCWQKNVLNESFLEKQKQFWAKELQNFPEYLELPLDKTRPAVFSHHGALVTASIPHELVRKLKLLANQEKSTLFMVLISAFQTLLHRISNQNDIIIGFPVSNRHYPGVESIMGFFANTVPLRTVFSKAMTFKDLLSLIRSKTTQIYENQDVPFEQLLDLLKVPREISHHPLFQVMFVYRNYHDTTLSLGNLEIETLFVPYRASKFDFTLSIEEGLEGINLELEYSTDLFERSTMERMANNFTTLLANIVSHPDLSLERIPLLDEKEYHTIVFDWNRTQHTLERDICLHQLFEEQAKLIPDHPALIFEDSSLTYSELNARINQLARYLRKHKVCSDQIVGVCLERSIELVIALYAVHKAEGAYLPLDPFLPQARLDYMLQDADVSVVITDRNFEHLFSNYHGTLVFENDAHDETKDNLDIIYTSKSLAYTIYTSGSTGLPKGVCIEHHSLINRILWMQHDYPLSHSDRILQKTPYSFDVSVWEFFWPLTVGATLVVAQPDIHRDPEKLIGTINQHFVTCIHFVPSLFSAFLECQGAQRCLTLKRIFTSGEALSSDLIIRFFAQSHAELHNLYGPTEGTIDVTSWDCSLYKKNQAVLIGKPIWNTTTYILDENHFPTPIGIPGELHLGGKGLARSYLNKPDLTQESFFELPFAPYERVYKTGDLARYLPDGSIEYLGRLDHQVKIRGFRIELLEIETVLCHFLGINKAIVETYEEKSGSTSLEAFYIAEHPLNEAMLEKHLKEKLPDYMIPSRFFFVDDFPLTSNGKLDRKGLKNLIKPLTVGKLNRDPKSKIEIELAEIWTDVLKLPTVGIDDNFFQLGGDSILSIRIIALAKKIGYVLELADFYRFPSIAQLANKVKIIPLAQDKISYVPFCLVSPPDKEKLPSDIEDAYPLASLQAGMIYHYELNSFEATYQDTFSYEIEGPLHIETLKKLLEEKISLHPALRTSFQFDVFEEPLQLVHTQGTLLFSCKDLSHKDFATQESLIEEWFCQEKKKRFDLSQPSLIRFHIHKKSKSVFQIGFTFHHAILDGWSVATLVSDLLTDYAALLEEQSPKKRSTSLTYGLYIQHEKNILKSEKSTSFWKEKLDRFQKSIIKFPNTKNENADILTKTRSLPLELTTALAPVASRLNVPIKSIYLAAYIFVLSRLSNQQDVTTGYILNGRPEEFDSENTLGLFLNTVPLRMKIQGGTWEELVLHVYQEEMEVIPHRTYPLSEIQQLFKGDILFDTSFNFAHFHVFEELKNSKKIKIKNHKAYEKTNFAFSANFYVDVATDNHYLSLEHHTKDIPESKIDRIFSYFESTLSAIATDQTSRIQHHSFLTDEEKHLLLHECNKTTFTRHDHKTFLSQFETHAKDHPHQIALICDDVEMTYGELSALADHVASQLPLLSSSPIIALSAERSIALIAGVLGIIKRGYAFTLLDPNYPQERQRYILNNSKIKLLLTQRHLRENYTSFKHSILDLESLLTSGKISSNHAIPSNSLAYLLYTSGSTGMPKGALISQKALHNQLSWLQHSFPLTDCDVVLHHTSLAFDVAVEEILWPLYAGAKLCLAPQNIHQDLDSLFSLVKKAGVTFIDLVPSLLDVLLQHPEVKNLNTVHRFFIGGEALHQSLVNRYFSYFSAPLINMYGLTETTITSTYYICSPTDASDIVPIGRPIDNTHVYVLDAFMNPIPQGVTGDLYVGGIGIAEGYVGDNSLNESAFVTSPFNGQTLYKTGDRARFLDNGILEYKGRSDNQVKIRGQRIELEEIEALLTKHPKVRHAVVETFKSQNLIAYVVKREQANVTEEELNQWLALWLSASLIPSKIYFLEKIPLLPSGKIDKKSLPKSTSNEKTIKLPLSFLEKQVIALWQDLLHLESIGMNDNFFALGGNSLSMTVLAMRAKKQFSKQIPLSLFLENPTPSQMTNILSETTTPDDVRIPFFSLPQNITPPIQKSERPRKETIFLTGATGFLGAHLLKDLIKYTNCEIFCLVRAQDIEHARIKLHQNYRSYFPNESSPLWRIRIFLGDLSRPGLGLSSPDYDSLIREVTMIFHCGAHVNHVFDYETLMPANVLSIIEILKIATSHHLKKVIQISTLSLTESSDNIVKEEINSQFLKHAGGYEQTKWVAEKLLEEASQRGIPVQIFRPGTIIGQSDTGICSYQDDHLMRLLKGCIQMESAPLWNLELDLLPVDFVSEAIVRIALQNQITSQIFNLSNPSKLSWIELIKILKQTESSIEMATPSEWQQALLSIDSENALYPLLSLYLDQKNSETNNLKLKIHYQNTLNALKSIGMSFPKENKTIIKNMISFVASQHFNKIGV